MEFEINVEVFREHLERSFKDTPNRRVFGQPELYRNWLLYCKRTENAELISEEK